MKNRYAFTLIIALEAGPTAAQPKGPALVGLAPSGRRSSRASVRSDLVPSRYWPHRSGSPLDRPHRSAPSVRSQGLGPEQARDSGAEADRADGDRQDDDRRHATARQGDEAHRVDDDHKVMIEDKEAARQGMKGFEPCDRSSWRSEDAKFKALEAKILVEVALDKMVFNFGQTGGEQHATAKRAARAGAEREAELYSQGDGAERRLQVGSGAGLLQSRHRAERHQTRCRAILEGVFAESSGQRSEALYHDCRALENHGSSPYRKRGTVLEAEVRRDMGQPVRPQDSTDDEVKLMALQALEHLPEEAVPMLEKVLRGDEHAARQVGLSTCLPGAGRPAGAKSCGTTPRGSSTPEPQSQAIRYLGVHGGVDNRSAASRKFTARPRLSTSSA